MYLQKLEIQGFKSFATKVHLEFTEGITAVVGPNGSGKSNIADAVRWVLGEQSMRLLRSKKADDVIFAGSDKKTRLGFAQVDLHFNNEDHKAPLDYPEVVISRRVYRSGEGEYFINKNKVRLQDVLLLLAKSSVGQRTYSIISQGMADMILNLTPAERKNFFDEAAGVREFQIKKDQAEHKLDATTENIKQADLLIHEIAPRLRSLTRQVHRLERRGEVLAQLKESQHRYYAWTWHDLAKHISEQERKQTDATSAQEAIAKTVNTLKQQLEALSQGGSRTQAFQKLEREYRVLTEEKSKLLRDEARLKGKMDVELEKTGHANLGWLERRLEELEGRRTQLEEEHASLETERKGMAQKQDVITRELQGVIRTIEQLNSQIEQQKNKVHSQRSTAVREMANDVAQLYERQEAFYEKLRAAQSTGDLKQLQAEAKNITDGLKDLSFKLRDQETMSPEEALALQAKLTELYQQKDRLTQTLHEWNMKTQAVDERLSFAREELDETETERERASGEYTAAKSQAGPGGQGVLREEIEKIVQHIKKVDAQILDLSQQLAAFHDQEEKKKTEIVRIQRALSDAQTKLAGAMTVSNDIKVELARLETRREDLLREMRDELLHEEMDRAKNVREASPIKEDAFQEIQRLKAQLSQIGGIDPQIEKEYTETKERHDFLTTQGKDLKKAMEDLEVTIENLDNQMKLRFNKSFEAINEQFGQYFKILFNGGSAKLGLIKEVPQEDVVMDEEQGESPEETEEDLEEEQKPKGEKIITGVEIIAQPPGKRLKGISMLSGGERALTSIALICAIIHNNPSPFIILDEVDAALDESNSIRFSSILGQLSKKTQFIVVTHNRATMQKANILYGVTMGDDGVSKLLSVKMEEAERVIERGTRG